jgi:hypothetical protein
MPPFVPYHAGSINCVRVGGSGPPLIRIGARRDIYIAKERNRDMPLYNVAWAWFLLAGIGGK